jgi:hypothetical protein
MEILLLAIGIIALIVVLILYSSLSWGFALYKFWYWFILPVFPGLPEITFWHAVGLFLFIVFFRIGDGQIIKDEYKEKTTGVIMSIITPWVTLLIGYMLKSMFM